MIQGQLTQHIDVEMPRKEMLEGFGNDVLLSESLNIRFKAAMKERYPSAEDLCSIPNKEGDAFRGSRDGSITSFPSKQGPLPTQLNHREVK